MLVLLICFIIISCTKTNYNNPFDPDVNLKKPHSLTLTRISINKIQLEWQNDVENASSYRIYKQVNNEGWLANFVILNGYEQTWSDSFVEINQTIQYKVITYCDQNGSEPAYSAQLNNILPTPENLVTEQQSLTSIKLNWSFDLPSLIDGFKIDKKLSNGVWDNSYGITGPWNRDWIDDNVEVNDNIKYRIYAYNDTIISIKVESNSISNFFEAPSNLNIQNITNESISLEWTYNGEWCEEFKIDRKIGNDWILNYATTNNTNWTDIDLEPGQTHTYRVRAYAQGIYSDYSDEVFVNFGLSDITCIVGTEGNINPVGAQIQLLSNLATYQTEILTGNQILIQDVLYGNYQASCSLPGFIDDLQDIIIDQDEFQLDFNLILGDGNWVHYDSDNYAAIGLNVNGGSHYCAIRFTIDELTQYENSHIFKIKFYIRDSLLELSIMIWEGGNYGNPGTLIYNVPIIDPQFHSWNEYFLETPIIIQEDREYWIGYYLDQNSGLYPAGVDEGPVIPAKGAWWSNNGYNWGELLSFNPDLDFNFNIRAYVVEGNEKGTKGLKQILPHANNDINPNTFIKKLDVFSDIHGK